MTSAMGIILLAFPIVACGWKFLIDSIMVIVAFAMYYVESVDEHKFTLPWSGRRIPLGLVLKCAAFSFNAWLLINVIGA